MTISRRQVLFRGGLVGAGLIASNVSGIEVLAQTQGVPVRKSLKGLAWDDPVVAKLRNGVGLLKAYMSDAEYNWVNLANIHGKYCPHRNWYFLPWHRAYITMYEKIIRLTAGDDFALPYWDWTNDPVMPAVFTMPKLPNGAPNALYDSTRKWPPNQPMPPSEVGPAVLSQIFGATHYEQFGTSRPPGQTDMNPIWLHGEGTMGILESTPHNHVHGNIGGNMVRTPTAALDPIFLMHHANVDRIWAAWNFKGGVNSAEFIWNNMPFTNNFWTGESTSRADPWSPKVNELYSPTTLGYSYDNVTTDRRLPAPPAMVALESRIRGLFSMTAPIGRTAGALSTFAVASAGSQVGTAKKPLDISVTVDSGRLAAVVRSNAAKVHDALLDFMNPQIRIDAPQTAPGPKVFALIRGVMLTNTENTHFHVFIDANGITDQTSTTDPHFVGSFALFDHGNHTGPDNGASLIVDLTDTVHALYGSGHPTGARMRVQIVPVANRPAESAPGTVMVDRIEVVFV